MRLVISALVMMMLSSAYSTRQCKCPCQPDGVKLKNLINCFSTWKENVATDENSYTEGCAEQEIIYCRAPKTDDLFCKFDGTNNLVETNDSPTCYYNCGMQTCNAFLIGHSPEEVDCIAQVFSKEGH